MKATIKFFILFLVLNSVTAITPQKATAQVSISFQAFYDDLSPYGNWVDNADYGYVWVPDVHSGFTPYGTDGYWAFTDAGWTWVSEYSWGWAPFHYGRWFYDRYYGWLWVPDNEWGPGWVSWRRSEGYYGWAPIGPGISIDFAYSSGYHQPYNQWTFVRDRDFGRTNINNYYINSSGNTTIINNSIVINNIYPDRSHNGRYNRGPDRNEVEKRAGRTFIPVAIRESNRPGQNMGNGELQLYRPQVEKNNNAVRKPAPSKVASMEEVKSAALRNPENRRQKEMQQVNQQPIKTQTNDQPVNQQPVRIPKEREQPVKQNPIDQPVKQQPVRMPPEREQPVKQKPIDQPVRQQPVRMPPEREQPVKQKPIDQPVKQQPARMPPEREQPVKQKPIDQPVKQQPVKDQPAKKQANDQPVKEQPVKKPSSGLL